MWVSLRSRIPPHGTRITQTRLVSQAFSCADASGMPLALNLNMAKWDKPRPADILFSNLVLLIIWWRLLAIVQYHVVVEDAFGRWLEAVLGV